MEISKLQFITNQWSSMPIEKQVEEFIAGGGRWVQLRLKNISQQEMHRIGLRVKDICGHGNATFIVNDSVALALALNAHGVHLGMDDMPPAKARKLLGANKIIGATANSIAHLAQAIKQPIQYVGYGPFRYTTTKEKLAAPMGIDGFLQAYAYLQGKQCSIPLIGIGGITSADILPILNSGVHGIALSGYIANSMSPKAATEELLEEIKNIKV